MEYVKQPETDPGFYKRSVFTVTGAVGMAALLIPSVSFPCSPWPGQVDGATRAAAEDFGP